MSRSALYVVDLKDYGDELMPTECLHSSHLLNLQDISLASHVPLPWWSREEDSTLSLIQVINITLQEECTSQTSGGCFQNLLEQIENITAQVLPLNTVTNILTVAFNASEKTLESLSSTKPTELASYGNRMLKTSEKLISTLVKPTVTSDNVSFTLATVASTLLWLKGRILKHHTRDPSSNPACDRKTESAMDPETLISRDLLTVIAQHESSFQCYEAVLSHQEELAKHSQRLADVMSSIRQLFDWLSGASPSSPSPSSRFWGAFCKLIGATASLSSGFHPESNGQTKWINQDLETTLWCMAANNLTSWATYINVGGICPQHPPIFSHWIVSL
ncbi:adhesion G -coupled receptor E3-like protein [Labeo rohita]|uniref:Adhesion G-coupled receptor E3-like protein n=1 Tax=Labeo rohita TaxID=84645 RepID=A0A498MB50_LABRO|nr:adhesion G -coupled receptor E3-like protein [Labeo rohita]